MHSDKVKFSREIYYRKEYDDDASFKKTFTVKESKSLLITAVKFEIVKKLRVTGDYQDGECRVLTF